MENKNYKNEYLGIAVDAQDGWQLTSRQTSLIKKSWQDIYQISEDELPAEENGMKRLFSLIKLSLDGLGLIAAEIEFAILKSKKASLWNYDSEAFEEVKETEIVNEREFRISTREEGDSKWRFYFSPFNDEYYFYCKVAIHKAELEAEAMSIFRSIRFSV